MKSKHIRNTEGVKKHAQMKSQEATQKVDKAIQHLIKTKAKINFNQVAMESGVSKAFLYNNQEIRNRIEGIRKQQEGLNTPKAIKHNMTDASKDSLIAAKNNRIKKLEEENKRLKDELLILHGMVYDKF
ncbi:transposase [Listeria monocytogenes]|nr:transposase [Listeria monocytogenes]